jgi:hypothetical protein
VGLTVNAPNCLTRREALEDRDNETAGF